MNLTERLQELAEAPAPPMRIDIERARAAGLRRRRGRQATIVATVAAVALAIAVATPAVLRSTRTLEQAPASVDGGAPLVTHAMFGWLPDSITRVDLGRGAHGDYAHAVNENADLGTHLWLSVRPAGNPPKPPSFGTATQHTVPAAPVNGQPAYWLTTNPADPLNAGDAYLRWQANGKLVELHGYYLNFANPEDLLLRVAAEATVTDRAIPLPVSVRDLPTDYQLTEAMFNRPMPRDTGTGAWDLTLFYTYNGAPITVLVHPSGSVTTTKDGSNLNCTSTNGIDICVTTGPATILDHITVLGLDESTWRAR